MIRKRGLFVHCLLYHVATEEIALRSGSTIGALLNATFGNAVELILGVIALKEGLIRVVQGLYLFNCLRHVLNSLI